MVNKKKFLDHIVKNITLPIILDLEFFNITDVKEKEYIIKQYFKDDDIVIKWCLLEDLVNYVTERRYSNDTNIRTKISIYTTSPL